MKITVFLDVQTEKIYSFVVSRAKALDDSAEIVPFKGPLSGVIRQREKLQQNTKERFTCFITENQTLEDADVVYALYCACIPVLCLSKKVVASARLLETIHSLKIDPCGDLCAVQINAVAAFFAFHPEEGQIIVFEGGDGSGKATQTEMLCHHLSNEGYRVATIDFPSDKDEYGWLIRLVLSGKKGGIRELDPKLFSLLYTLNRFACSPCLRYWMHCGMKVVLDRYYTSNYGHQASKLPEEERKGSIDNLSLLEISWFGLPESNLVFFLNLPPHVALSAMKADTSRANLDIHESEKGAYKENVRKTYLWCCNNLPNWILIECCNNAAQRLSREKVHDCIYNSIKDKLS